jgi:hypothetical protein
VAGRGLTILGDHFLVSITAYDDKLSAAELLKMGKGLDLARSSTNKST